MKKLAFSESEQTEFKDCRGTKRAKLPDDLWQSIAAFSNSHGGKIFLGIEDDGTMVNLSIDDIDKLQKDLSTLLSNNFFNNKLISVVGVGPGTKYVLSGHYPDKTTPVK